MYNVYHVLSRLVIYVMHFMKNSIHMPFTIGYTLIIYYMYVYDTHIHEKFAVREKENESE